jgi:cation transport regulator ChaB
MEKKLADRFNQDKLRWRNFPLFLIRPLAQVAQYGEGKYDTYNFLKGGSQNQYLDCIKRHLDSYEDPAQDDLDQESRVNHLAHVAWNALTAIYMLENFPELDDRFKIVKDGD